MSLETALERYQVPVAWGLLALAVVLVLLVLVLPVTEAYVERGERLQQGYERLAKLEAIAAQQPGAIRDQQKELGRILGRYAFSADRGTDGLVLDLRKKMDALAGQYDVDLQSVESSNPRREDDIVSVGLSVTASAGLEGAIGMLQALQQQTPVMLVDDLSVQSAPQRRSRRNAKEAADPPAQRVSLKFRIEAFVAPGAG